MARITKQPAETLELSEDEKAEIAEEIRQDLLEEEGENEDIEVESLLTALKGDGEVEISVHRCGKGRKSPSLFTCGADDYTLGELQDKLRLEYGTGEYKIEARRQGKYCGRKIIAVEAPKVRELHNQNISSDLMPLFDSLKESNRLAQESQRENANQLQSMMFQQMKSNQELLIALLNKPETAPITQPQGPTLTELLSLMTSVKELGNDNKQIDLLIKGMELGQQNSAGDENVLQTAIKSFAPAVNKISELSTIPNPQSNQPIPDQPAVKENIEETKQDELIMGFKLSDLQFLEPHINVLLNAAKQNADFITYANYITDQIPVALIENFIINEEKYLTVFKLFPPMANYKQWFDGCRMVVIESVEQLKNVQSGSNVCDEPASSTPVIIGEFKPAPSDVSNTPADK